MEKLTSNKSCPNAPGYVRMWLTSIEEVENITLSGENTRSVTFAADGAWGEVEATNIAVSEEYADGYYTLSITADLTTIDPVDPILDQLCQMRVLVMLKGRNGQKYLAGSFEQPLNFAYELSADRDEHTYHLTMSRKTTQPISRMS